MEKTIVNLSQLRQKGVWNFEPYSQVVTGTMAQLEKSPFPVVKLGTLGTTQRGYFINGIKDRGEIPLISVRNISTEGINLNHVRYLTPEEHNKLEKTQVHKGDVLVSLIMRPGIAAVYESDEPANIDTHLARLRLTDKIDPAYLTLYLNSDDGQALIHSLSTGSIQPMLTLAALNNLPIMLPSRDEQKQIVVEAQRLIKEAEQLSKAAKDHRAEAQKLVGKLFQGGV
ncbi:restriction endonuclease subunit S [Aphanizomenon sp. PH219]|uniref:Restriction endonuclease subunit S n=1 Tax=Dolichospermum heterosporum TAC447 TaxID=747523 RepID=A0ABY5LTL5_9CYAN|nr:restriction endonuclease subunit S [Dolichospermum heterosporum]MDK2408573.1 restriction endonuclease subunit S [Aphanizomenon sp. 202]MDK2459425.1 restriction endonuclease subunit S [Aphanizomenon sp. PH219]UUO14087.1 restriction endonuclease subunit S [Dolichospermum heterosporum TAC447]